MIFVRTITFRKRFFVILTNQSQIRSSKGKTEPLGDFGTAVYAFDPVSAHSAPTQFSVNQVLGREIQTYRRWWHSCIQQKSQYKFSYPIEDYLGSRNCKSHKDAFAIIKIGNGSTPDSQKESFIKLSLPG